MKFFIVLLASVVAASAIITRPDVILDQIDAQETVIIDYKATILESIRALRQGGSEASAKQINDGLDIIVNNIKTLGVSDVPNSDTLALIPTTPCIVDLQSIVEQIWEFSGFAISNCVELQNPTTGSTSSEISAALDTLERKVSALELIVVNALIDRNIFTEGADVVNDIQGQFDARKTEIDGLLADLNTQAGASREGFAEELQALTDCFADIDNSVQSGYSMVESQLPVCAKFGTRGARSIININVRDFFPKLEGKY